MLVFLLLGLLILSIYSLVTKDLLYGTIALSAFSVLSAALFYILNAPDVAITEAAVGAGVSTVIFVWAIRATRREDTDER
jgi:energy-converting hydrogenase B subunit D